MNKLTNNTHNPVDQVNKLYTVNKFEKDNLESKILLAYIEIEK